MKITLNGQVKELPNTPNLGSIVDRFCKNNAPVIAELNGEIIQNSRWGETALNDGDSVELVSFVGGGSHSLLVDRCLVPPATHNEQLATSNLQQIL